MMGAPQIIDLQYDGKRHWFKVWRYSTEQDLLSALRSDQQEAHNGTESHVTLIKDGEECGRIYLLDKTVDTIAKCSSDMAFHIVLRSGKSFPDGFRSDVSELTGHIASEIYSQSSAF